MQIYNTLTRKQEEFTPGNQEHIKIYSCGLTVYSHPHIGNWVGYIYWDVLQRYYEEVGIEVERVQNITDVGHLVSDDDSGEDKMEKGAKAEGKTAWEVADKYIEIANREGYEVLRLRKPKLIRATDLIKEQIEFVEELEKKGFTYRIDGEGIYFDTSKLSDYGKLARLDIKGLEEGARVKVDGKKNPTDFALWKFSPKDQKRDMEWESPWGTGFPGWHLECSVIARTALGDQIHAHTGGIDHIPVHHTNEIAQTESVTGKQFSKFWLHNNHIKVDGTKMSKSLGNVYTLVDIEERGYDPQAFKVLVLSKHYQTEGNFTWEILDASQNRLKNWYAVADLAWQLPNVEQKNQSTFINDVMEAVGDDLDTPKALNIIDEKFNALVNANLSPSLRELEFIDNLLGIKLAGEDISERLKSKLLERKNARDSKDWEASDRIRDELKEEGIGLNDSTTGQTWYRI